MELALSLFAGLAQRFGTQPVVLAAVLAIVLGFAAVGGLLLLGFYYVRSRIGLMERAELAATDERKKDLDARERERAALLQEVQGSRAQLHQFMTNHLEHDRQDRERFAAHITQSVTTQQAIAASLESHREEERDRAGSLHQQINQVQITLGEIKGASSK